MTTQPVSVGERTIVPGEKESFRFACSETYNGDPVGVP